MKLAKDVLYTHDTLEIFGARLGDMRREWQEHVRLCLHKRAANTVERRATRLFGETSDPVREAARMAGDRRLTPEAILEACHFGLEQIFG